MYLAPNRTSTELKKIQEKIKVSLAKTYKDLPDSLREKKVQQ